MGHKVKPIMLWTVCNISNNLVLQLVHISLDIVISHVHNFEILGCINEHNLLEID